MIKIEYVESLEDVYDITVEKNSNFFANSILVHNCSEINLPTKPLNDLHDPDGEIALCTLGAINFGKINHPDDLEKPCELIVRALDEILSNQRYPIEAAREATMKRRPLGIGIINFAYWLAKNDIKYENIDAEQLQFIHEYVEAWSYYLIKTSVQLAKEKGPCLNYYETRYSRGILPIDIYNKNVDDLLKEPDNYKQDWQTIKNDLIDVGIRNSTLMALMPSETSSQLSNSTNGIEPPRSIVSYKQSKDGVLKQVVPEPRKLKNKYDLLWNQKSPQGYLKICAVLQKFIDQGISVNTSYNPKNYKDEQIPLSTMLTDLIFFYRMGGKQLYYFNTYDGSGEIEFKNDGEDCDSCTI